MLNSVLAIVCPGQGSQKPGFLTPWMESRRFADHMGWLSAAAGIDLAEHGTVSDEATIKDTSVAQPLLVAAGIAVLGELFDDQAALRSVVSLTGGHSVGEITAAVAAGVLSPEQAMIFVRERGNGMAAAAAQSPTGMSAILGGDTDEVVAALETCGLAGANFNSAGQIVAAGALDKLEALPDALPAKTRVVALPVAGAFHTHYMSSAVATLERHARAMAVADPTIGLLTNADGRLVTSGTEFLELLVGQVSQPVRWDKCMQTMTEQGVTALIELTPAGTLTGLAKRAMKGVPSVAIKSPADLDAAKELIAEHGDQVIELTSSSTGVSL